MAAFVDTNVLLYGVSDPVLKTKDLRRKSDRLLAAGVRVTEEKSARHPLARE